MQADTQNIKTAAPDSSKVFVVYGRNEAIRRALFDFLRAIGLKPIEWSQAITLTGKGSPFIGEVLDAAFQHAQAVVVLLTGDDKAKLRSGLQSKDDPDYEKDLSPQARPNVLFEAGLALGRNPDRTVLVEIGTLRPFSDIAGRHTVRLDNSMSKRQDLAQRLRTAGCVVDLTGTDWHHVGDFDVPSAPATVAQAEEKVAMSLHADAVRIMRGLSSKGRGGYFFVDDIASILNMHPQWVEYFLKQLVNESYVGKSIILPGSDMYVLSEKGWNFLIVSNVI